MTRPDDEDMAALAVLCATEYQQAEAQAADSFEAYWAGSASASVLRDHAAGRATSTAPVTGARRRSR